MGDGSLLLVLPGENGLHGSPKVCVWAQEGIKEQGHRALAPAFKAFRQVIQVLEVVHRSEGHWSKAAPSCIPTISGWSDKLGKCCLIEVDIAHQQVKGSDKSCSPIYLFSFAKPISLRLTGVGTSSLRH